MKALIYDLESLKPAASKFLTAGFCSEDLRSFEISQDGYFDFIYDSGNGPSLEEIPEEFWKALSLPTGVKEEIQNLWEEDPEAPVIWR